ncbi:aldehyde dehydrogenase [Sediminitomix flava]|uniref:Aldehyde dehydrogenase n=1 Tax=Sediminitomix flava TaxID=379075 RepID=A0A315Z9F5_SEDFL|nr:aldehyde dehydrogenase [Sediminitomix flava]PWJ41829.1 aldehyde dehydrogenase (NAD+) [Sediminitomix flava]
MVTTTESAQDWTAQSINSVLEKQKAFFKSNKTIDIQWRVQQLKKLAHVIKRYEKDILDALYKDFKKSEFEGYATEVGLMHKELQHIIKKTKSWAKTKKSFSSLINFPSTNYIYQQPYGNVLIIGPWNYPFHLTLFPLFGAISAGNTAILKPSELTPHTSAIIEKIITECFEPEFVAVVQGGVQTSQDLLNQRFDYIFFTGSVNVGKIVAEKAAKYLTPVTLELGGKSPCIVSHDADIKVAARRIVWGKFVNGGQTCIAPDYILVQSSVKEELIKEIGKTIESFYGKNPQDSTDFPRIINERNFDRLAKMFEGANIVIGGQTDRNDLYIAPSVLDDVKWEDPVMAEEIFGPILPVISYEEIDKVPEIVNGFERPLALYLFTKDKETENLIMESIPFGSGCVNDTLGHMAEGDLPFGGIGESGIGRYHGNETFHTFSHKKSVMKKGFWFDLPLRYPPYKGKLGLVRQALRFF